MGHTIFKNEEETKATKTVQWLNCCAFFYISFLILFIDFSALTNLNFDLYEIRKFMLIFFSNEARQHRYDTIPLHARQSHCIWRSHFHNFSWRMNSSWRIQKYMTILKLIRMAFFFHSIICFSRFLIKSKCQCDDKMWTNWKMNM